MDQWMPEPQHADAAFGRAVQATKQGGKKSASGKLRLPFEDEKLWPFAKKVGLSDAQVGETFPQYRSRLKTEIRRREDEREKSRCIRKTV